MHKQIIEWKKQLEMFKDCNNKKAMSLRKGRESLLIPYTDTLLSFIFKLRETGMPVSTTMVLMKAAQVCHNFHEKTREGQVSIMKWFVKVHRMALNWHPFIPMSTRRDAGGGTGLHHNNMMISVLDCHLSCHSLYVFP